MANGQTQAQEQAREVIGYRPDASSASELPAQCAHVRPHYTGDFRVRSEV